MPDHWIIEYLIFVIAVAVFCDGSTSPSPRYNPTISTTFYPTYSTSAIPIAPPTPPLIPTTSPTPTLTSPAPPTPPHISTPSLPTTPPHIPIPSLASTTPPHISTPFQPTTSSRPPGGGEGAATTSSTARAEAGNDFIVPVTISCVFFVMVLAAAVITLVCYIRKGKPTCFTPGFARSAGDLGGKEMWHLNQSRDTQPELYVNMDHPPEHMPRGHGNNHVSVRNNNLSFITGDSLSQPTSNLFTNMDHSLKDETQAPGLYVNTEHPPQQIPRNYGNSHVPNPGPIRNDNYSFVIESLSHQTNMDHSLKAMTLVPGHTWGEYEYVNVRDHR